MAVISVNRIGDQRVYQVNNNNDGECDIDFRVRTDTPTDGAAIVLNAFGASQAPGGTLAIPPPWAAYGPPWVSTNEQKALIGMLALLPNAACKCIRRRAAQTDNDQTWVVTATFASSSPLSIPTKVTFGPERIKVGMDNDINGTPIRNSYGDPFQNPFQADSNNLRMRVVKNLAKWNPVQQAINLSNQGLASVSRRAGGTPLTVTGSGFYGVGVPHVGGALNADDWWGFKALTVRLLGVEAEFMNDLTDVFPYWRVTYEFLIDATGHNYQPLDRGFRGISTSGRLSDPFLGSTGQRRSLPTLLDGAGNELLAGVPPVYLNFVVYPPLDFGTLGLGDPPPFDGYTV